MRRVLFAAAALLSVLWGGAAHAAGCIFLPYTLTAGTLASAAQVMANFNAGVACVNAITNNFHNITADYNPLTNSFLTGNPAGSTVTGFSSQGTAIQAGKRQAQGIFGITNTASGSTACSGGTLNGNCDMIALYAGNVLNGGLLNGFAINELLTVSSGWNAANVAGLSGSGGAWVNEIDINNLDANFGETGGQAGLLVPFSYGHQFVATQGVISGSTFFRNTAAIVISTIATSAGPGWNRGVVCSAFAPVGDVKQACYSDYSQSAISYDMQGTHATAGIDGSQGVYSTYFIKGPLSNTSFWDGNGNAQFVSAVLKNSGGGVNPAIYTSGGNLWEGFIYNATNATKQNGLLISTDFNTNGSLILETHGWTTSYDNVPLSEAGRRVFKPGKNLIAIHCRQNGGGQYVDLGLVTLQPSETLTAR